MRITGDAPPCGENGKDLLVRFLLFPQESLCGYRTLKLSPWLSQVYCISAKQSVEKSTGIHPSLPAKVFYGYKGHLYTSQNKSIYH